jgi:hypothetical protein
VYYQTYYLHTGTGSWVLVLVPVYYRTYLDSDKSHLIAWIHSTLIEITAIYVSVNADEMNIPVMNRYGFLPRHVNCRHRCSGKYINESHRRFTIYKEPERHFPEPYFVHNGLSGAFSSEWDTGSAVVYPNIISESQEEKLISILMFKFQRYVPFRFTNRDSKSTLTDTCTYNHDVALKTFGLFIFVVDATNKDIGIQLYKIIVKLNFSMKKWMI